jgi:hypothetical protein
VVSQSVMAAIMLVYLAAGINSFRAARRNR